MDHRSLRAGRLIGPAEAEARFAALTDRLVSHRHHWEPRPFSDREPPWCNEEPALARWLRGLSHGEIDVLEEATTAPDAAAAAVYARWHSRTRALTRVPAIDADLPVGIPAGLKFRVPGRKWAQVAHFVGAVRAEAPPSGAIVDWCGGKGHLGRTLGQLTGGSVDIIDIDGRLAAQAGTLAARLGVDVAFHELDARAPHASGIVRTDSTVVALHACGGLTNAALVAAAERGPAALFVAPCCYHKLHAEPTAATRPLSRAGRDSGLALTHTALRLATADEVVAPQRTRRRRRRENAWRLGLDELVREATGVDAYTPLGTLDPATLRLDFGPFCERVASMRDLPLPGRWDPQRAKARGEERCRTARALGLVRVLYRRVIELWLVLDRALFLAEAGRPIGVGRFCARKISPRDLLIQSVAARA